MGSTFEPEDEGAVLGGFLDWYREVMVGKVADLSTAEAKQVSTPSGVTLLGLIKHLTWAEHLWFDHYLMGGSPPTDDNTASFGVDVSDTLEDALHGYRVICERSRETTAGLALDTPIATTHAVFGSPSLRWVMLHMIEETARHAGHADVLRELTDGRTGG